jgi:hypothetical protein
MSAFQPPDDSSLSKMSTRSGKIRALAEWALKNGIRFGDVAGLTKLQTVAETWFPTACDETVASYLRAVLRILEREGPRTSGASATCQ